MRRKHPETKSFDELVSANVGHLIALRALTDRQMSKKRVAYEMGITADQLSHLLHQEGQRSKRWLGWEMAQAARVLRVSLDRLVQPLPEDGDPG